MSQIGCGSVAVRLRTLSGVCGGEGKGGVLRVSKGVSCSEHRYRCSNRSMVACASIESRNERTVFDEAQHLADGNALLFYSGSPVGLEEEEIVVVEDEEHKESLKEAIPLVQSTRRSRGKRHGKKKSEGCEDDDHGVASLASSSSMESMKVNSKRNQSLVKHGLSEDLSVPIQYRQLPGTKYMECVEKDTEFLMHLRSWLSGNRKSKRGRRGSKGTNVSSSGDVTSFLVSLGNTPVLTAKQEQHLASIIARGKSVREAD